jgi:hypothetical protein
VTRSQETLCAPEGLLPKEQLEYWQALAHQQHAALRELVECKEMKERLRSYEFGSTQEMAAFAEEYDRRKPAAWDAARAAIAKAEGQP